MDKVLHASTSIADFLTTSAAVNSHESETYIANTILSSATNPSSTGVVTFSTDFSVSTIA